MERMLSGNGKVSKTNSLDIKSKDQLMVFAFMSGYANTLLCKLYGECLYPNNERDKIDPRDTGEQLATYSSTIHPNPTNHSINIEVKG